MKNYGSYEDHAQKQMKKTKVHVDKNYDDDDYYYFMVLLHYLYIMTNHKPLLMLFSS